MRVTLIIARYPWWAVPFAFLSMMFFRLPLMTDKNISFWRLMGSGRNGTFDLVPDLQQWAIILVHKNNFKQLDKTRLTGSGFINSYHSLFNAKLTAFLLEPIEGHGLWNGKEVFGSLPKQTRYEGSIAVLTRATIRLSQLKAFWKNVPAVNRHMKSARGLLQSFGIGEIPFIKQATFSTWTGKQAMKDFAYGMQDHKEVIRKTHSEKWYSEEMFVRFKILDVIK
jgi:hypothetical protein